MEKRINNYILKALFVLTIGFGMLSCESFLDVKPDKALEPEQFYRDRFDADAAVTGIYGKFLNLADEYVILNELRADLMDVTNNADRFLRELNTHDVSEENPYANPRPFYELILYCNDVLTNFDIMLTESKLSQADYNERYSDIATLRCWLYLQLVIHWGEVPYITDPLLTVDDLKDISGFPKLGIEEMVQELINVMEALPVKDPYSINSTLNISVDGWNTRTFFINKKFFLGDLYLWKGDYLKAAEKYKDVMMMSVSGVDAFDSYKIKYADVTNHNDLAVGYVRFKEEDYYSLIDNSTQGWRSMFIRPQDPLFYSEWIWVLPFESRFGQGTPFVDIFSNNYGRYLVKPAKSAIDLWNSQVQYNSIPWDQRGKFTYGLEGGEPAIQKYTYNYSPLTPLEKNGKWFLSRAALLHLRFIEAANRDDEYKLAWALLNNGIATTYNDPVITDVTQEFDTFLPFPYDFSARQTNVPYFRDAWHRNTGLRGRAYVYPYPIDSANYYGNVTDAIALKENIEDNLITEAALELAYEGNRWGDLVRVAIRRSDPSFLANRVADKLVAAENPDAEAVRQKLGDRTNWFLPFRLK